MCLIFLKINRQERQINADRYLTSLIQAQKKSKSENFFHVLHSSLICFCDAADIIRMLFFSSFYSGERLLDIQGAHAVINVRGVISISLSLQGSGGRRGCSCKGRNILRLHHRPDMLMTAGRTGTTTQRAFSEVVSPQGNNLTHLR